MAIKDIESMLKTVSILGSNFPRRMYRSICPSFSGNDSLSFFRPYLCLNTWVQVSCCSCWLWHDVFLFWVLSSQMFWIHSSSQCGPLVQDLLSPGPWACPRLSSLSLRHHSLTMFGTDPSRGSGFNSLEVLSCTFNRWSQSWRSLFVCPFSRSPQGRDTGPRVLSARREV